ncbi:NAD-dependent epimerase/dehydratase family protein [Xylanimonas allomyrinae]|uniref:NAD-dependent epimerase/dehydratase family protein n=1 Tax=Xylanimonas allomyrinae TaxID=2509459 RepID=A0A4P6EK89_9MICO|nr:NAD-dependent epimerase/dehydratase family protein [Xylanimonas allomyrinae]QAY63100.1 NAD-dependent epimerase/dehydratase family protein [Xylanimonas allomyrinae]
MRIAVTGAGGYVARNLVPTLVSQGHTVTAVDGSPTLPWTAEAAVRAVRADVRDAPAMRAALDGTDLVFHLAARITLRQTDPLAWSVNTDGVRTVARAALAVGVGRLVHCSSVHAYDLASGVIDETSPRAVRAGLPVYDRSKARGELELARVVDAGLDAVTVNPTGIYGPVDHVGRLAPTNAVLRRAALGTAFLDVAGGFDFVDVRDVVAGLLLAARLGRTGEGYLLAGERLVMHEMLGAVAGLLGRRPPLLTVPFACARAIGVVAGPLSRRDGVDALSPAALGTLRAAPHVCSGKARRELGYAPRPSRETLRDTAAFLVTSGALRRTRARTGR